MAVELLKFPSRFPIRLKATVWNCLKFQTISNKGRFPTVFESHCLKLFEISNISNNFKQFQTKGVGPMCLKATVWNCLKFHTISYNFIQRAFSDVFESHCMKLFEISYISYNFKQRALFFCVFLLNGRALGIFCWTAWNVGTHFVFATLRRRFSVLRNRRGVRLRSRRCV